MRGKGCGQGHYRAAAARAIHPCSALLLVRMLDVWASSCSDFKLWPSNSKPWPQPGVQAVASALGQLTIPMESRAAHLTLASFLASKSTAYSSRSCTPEGAAVRVLAVLDGSRHDPVVNPGLNPTILWRSPLLAPEGVAAQVLAVIDAANKDAHTLA